MLLLAAPRSGAIALVQQGLYTNKRFLGLPARAENKRILRLQGVEQVRSSVMSSPDDDFHLLMGRVRAGSDEAAQELVELFGGYVRRAVRRVLNPTLRSLFDTVDFTQLVWLKFFVARERLERFESPAELAKYLIEMARNQVVSAARRHRIGECDVNREQQSSDDSWQEAEQVPDRGPPPIDVAIGHEQLERMLAGQPPHFREIIELRLRGLTHEQVAHLLHTTRGDVHRFLKKLSGKYP